MVAEQQTPLGAPPAAPRAGSLAGRPQQAQPLTAAGLALPSPVHAVLEERQLRPGRMIVIGDVHGCPDELQELLDKWARTCLAAAVQGH